MMATKRLKEGQANHEQGQQFQSGQDSADNTSHGRRKEEGWLASTSCYTATGLSHDHVCKMYLSGCLLGDSR